MFYNDEVSSACGLTRQLEPISIANAGLRAGLFPSGGITKTWNMTEYTCVFVLGQPTKSRALAYAIAIEIDSYFWEKRQEFCVDRYLAMRYIL